LPPLPLTPPGIRFRTTAVPYIDIILNFRHCPSSIDALEHLLQQRRKLRDGVFFPQWVPWCTHAYPPGFRPVLSTWAQCITALPPTPPVTRTTEVSFPQRKVRSFVWDRLRLLWPRL